MLRHVSYVDTRAHKCANFFRIDQYPDLKLSITSPLVSILVFLVLNPRMGFFQSNKDLIF